GLTLCFFFEADDGIRDRNVTGVQTCALPIFGWTEEAIRERFGFSEIMMSTLEKDPTNGQDEALLDIYRKLRPGEPPTKESAQSRSEERRVGKEGRSRSCRGNSMNRSSCGRNR